MDLILSIAYIAITATIFGAIALNVINEYF